MTSFQYQQQHLFLQNNNINSNNNGNFNFLHPFSDDDWNCNYFNYGFDHFYEDDNYKECGSNQKSASSEMAEYSAGVTAVKVPKRRRRVKTKNKEEIENQRMTHIAVERNRRKQMNDYLSALRALMPNSYVQRGDQASIIEGAINFVKELEQTLQCLSAKKQPNNMTCVSNSSSSSLPFGEFFSFPQYSATTNGGDQSATSHRVGDGEVAADVEVKMVESHALLKIRTKKPFKKLSKLVVGLQSLRLSILHLNVSNLHGVAFYTFSLKVDDDEKKVSSMDEIARAVYQLLAKIQQDPNNSC